MSRKPYRPERAVIGVDSDGYWMFSDGYLWALWRKLPFPSCPVKPGYYRRQGRKYVPMGPVKPTVDLRVVVADRLAAARRPVKRMEYADLDDGDRSLLDVVAASSSAVSAPPVVVNRNLLDTLVWLMDGEPDQWRMGTVKISESGLASSAALVAYVDGVVSGALMPMRYRPEALHLSGEERRP